MTPPPEGAPDYEARTAAARALDKIESHEAHCAERWSEARKESQQLREDIRTLSEERRAEGRRMYDKLDGMAKNMDDKLAAIVQENSASKVASAGDKGFLRGAKWSLGLISGAIGTVLGAVGTWLSSRGGP